MPVGSGLVSSTAEAQLTVRTGAQLVVDLAAPRPGRSDQRICFAPPLAWLVRHGGDAEHE